MTYPSFLDRLVELHCDPLEALVTIAGDQATDVAMRARIYAVLLSYLYPKGKAVEVAAYDDDGLAAILQGFNVSSNPRR